MILYEGILDKAKDFVKNNKGKLAALAGVAALAGGAAYAAHQAGGFDKLANNITSGSLGNLLNNNQPAGNDHNNINQPVNNNQPAGNDHNNNNQPVNNNQPAGNDHNNNNQPVNNNQPAGNNQKDPTNNIVNKVIQQKTDSTGTVNVTGNDVQAAVNTQFNPESFIKQHGGAQQALNYLMNKRDDPFTSPVERMAIQAEINKLFQYTKTHPSS